MLEPDRGQYLEFANWIQDLDHRQCIMRRYVSEHKRENKIQFVKQTDELPHTPLKMRLQDAKNYLTQQRGVRVRDALEVINQREIKVEPKKPPSM